MRVARIEHTVASFGTLERAEMAEECCGQGEPAIVRSSPHHAALVGLSEEEVDAKLRVHNEWLTVCSPAHAGPARPAARRPIP